MRLVYANAFYLPNNVGGGNAHIYQFIRNAVALGHEVWTWPPDEHPEARHVPANRLKRLALLCQADVIYVRLEHRAPGMAHWTLPPYRSLLGSVPIVWEFNTVPEMGFIYGESQEEVERTVATLRRFGRGLDLACCVTQTLADYVQEELGIRRVLVVPNGSDPEMFRPDVEPVKRVQRDPERLNVVWIGRTDIPWHNFDLLRRAAESLWQRDEGRGITFHLLGQGHGLMRDMPPSVHYYGPDDYQAMPHWLAAMDVGLSLHYPGSARFASPIKIFDYMASGLAVVSTDHPQVQEIFAELGQTELLVAPDAPEALANLLIRLKDDRPLLKRLGRAGRQLVIDRYNWRRAVTDTLAEILEICREKRRSLKHSAAATLLAEVPS
jgi:glycosyltransferase involved in cell wall biosynthesis